VSLHRRIFLAGVALLLLTGFTANATWTVVPTPDPGAGRNMLISVDVRSTTEAWAVGLADDRPLAVRWNGTAWSAVSTPALSGDAQFNGVDGSASNNVWAVGSGPGSSALAERWNGTAWSTVAVPLPAGATGGGLMDVKTFSATSAFAVGEHRSSSAPFRRTLVSRWNGSAWSVLPSPNPDGTQNLLFAVDGVSNSDVWAIGGVGHDGYGGDVVAPLVLRWNGSAWSEVTIPASSQFSITRVEDVVTVAANDVWIVGTAFDRAMLQHVPYWAHWNGTGFQQGTLPGAPGGRFDAVTALSATKVYAVGSLIARWNGTAWAVESTPPGSLRAADVVGPGTVWTVGSTYDGSDFTTLAMRTTNG
jgi:hypothetical protein